MRPLWSAHAVLHDEIAFRVGLRVAELFRSVGAFVLDARIDDIDRRILAVAEAGTLAEGSDARFGQPLGAREVGSLGRTSLNGWGSGCRGSSSGRPSTPESVNSFMRAGMLTIQVPRYWRALQS